MIHDPRFGLITELRSFFDVIESFKMAVLGGFIRANFLYDDTYTVDVISQDNTAHGFDEDQTQGFG